MYFCKNTLQVKRIINHRDFNIFKIEKTVWDIDYHNHNFYEIILVEEGSGNQRLNDVTFLYKKGDVFFLKPDDAHEFFIEEKTSFMYIKFTNQFIGDLMLWNDSMRNKLNFDDLLLKSSNYYESFINNEDDQMHFRSLANMIYYEFNHFQNRSFELIFQLFLSLILLLMRNIVSHSSGLGQLKVNKIDKILSYITINALNPEKMKIANLAQEFSLSEKYISIYFKAQTGLSIQNHVTQIKIKAAEKLLINSSYNVNEIAIKLGFNDASHFNKFFKKYKLISPTEFQKIG
jgi:AraC family transcriptional regulator, L-rhamnose operon regulatory protein RhaS